MQLSNKAEFWFTIWLILIAIQCQQGLAQLKVWFSHPNHFLAIRLDGIFVLCCPRSWSAGSRPKRSPYFATSILVAFCHVYNAIHIILAALTAHPSDFFCNFLP